MRIPDFLRRSFAVCFTLISLVSCRAAPKADSPFSSSSSSPNFSESLQEPQISSPEPIEPITPTTPLPPIESIDPEPTIWDVSDVDVSYVRKDKKLIAFTFDDAPKRTLENILSVFAFYNQSSPNCKATATLFCNGVYINTSSKQLLSAACALNFELGNHTYSHVDLTELSPFDLEWEIDATDALLYKLDGKNRHLLRAPFGKLNQDVRSYAHTPIIDWTIDTLDWTGAMEEEIYQTVWKQKFSGAIVLMHDGYPNTVSALKRLLPDLRDAGYQVVSVSAMAKAHECPLRRGGVYIRARKNGVF